jgi:hypothetical protein
MYLTNLAAIARGAGLTVVEQGGWQSRGHGGMTDVRAIICHHTGGLNALGTVQNGRPDLPGPLSHFYLGQDGTVYVVAAGLCYHAGATLASWQSNAHTIGIEAEATGTSSWPEVQLAAYAKLCRALSDAFGGVPTLGHKEVCAPVGRKIDPNFDMAAFRGRVANQTSGGGGAPASGTTLTEDQMAQGTKGTGQVSIPVNGAKRLFCLIGGKGSVVKGHIYWIKDTPAGAGAAYAGDRVVQFDADRPGPVSLPDGVRGATFFYDASADFAIWAV